MSGRRVIYANSTEENGFAAMPDKNVKADLIYLCSPNNQQVLFIQRTSKGMGWSALENNYNFV